VAFSPRLLQMGAAGSATANFIEDVFSTFLWTSTGSNVVINNGIDLSTKGGLVWEKCRSVGVDNTLTDTARGVDKTLVTNTTSAESTGGVQTFSTNGFTTSAYIASRTFCSWTFRKQAKFFDIVTYTGTGSNTTIAHNLGSVPGMIFVKRTDTTGAWQVYHRSLANTDYLVLNTTAASATGATRWNSTTPTSSVFSLGTDATVNASGGTYVAYLFAHDAGGFGTAGTDNVISCGSVTTNGSGAASVTLGYEPQWVLLKNSQAVENWQITDIMRGMPVGSADALLLPNSSDAESSYDDIDPTATGFNLKGLNSSQTYIYMAIRRPMKVPTTGTSVFAVNLAADGSTAPITWNTNSTVDAVLIKRNLAANNGTPTFVDRLRGTSKTLQTSGNGIEGTNANIIDLIISNGYIQKSVSTGGSGDAVSYAFSRASKFFDIVCYTGTGSATTITHNLSAVPEMMIVKRRDTSSANWCVYANNDNTDFLQLNLDSATVDLASIWNDTSPTSSVFSIGDSGSVNASASNYVAYLFATLAGVSKVGTYTGNGSNQTINCGFTAGARFVLIKKISGTGNWCVFDTARGIVSGNDPFLQLNNELAQTTGEDAVDPANSGFIVNETTEAINTNSATYIFLAIA